MHRLVEGEEQKQRDGPRLLPPPAPRPRRLPVPSHLHQHTVTRRTTIINFCVLCLHIRSTSVDYFGGVEAIPLDNVMMRRRMCVCVGSMEYLFRGEVLPLVELVQEEVLDAFCAPPAHGASPQVAAQGGELAA